MPDHQQKTVSIASVKLSLADIQRIYKRLDLQLAEQADFEIAHVTKVANQTDEQFAEYKVRARNEAFKITTSLIGRDGQTLFGADAAIFESANRPDKLQSIYMTNGTAYTSFSGRRPICLFELNLDFSKPKLLDFSVSVSAPTPNASNLTVQGDREAWVAAITDAVSSVTRERTTRRGWIHRGSVYDIGLLLFGLPFALYLCWKVSSFVENHLGSINQFLAAAAFVYVFFIALHFYRVLFGYTKWAFPSVELVDNQDEAAKHRAIWGGIIFAMVVNVIWELRNLI